METRYETMETEEIDDDLPVGRVLSRREVLRLAGMAGLGLTAFSFLLGGGMLRAETGEPIDLVASPEVTEGPFFVDEKLNRSNLLADTNRDAVTAGTPLRLSLRVFTVKNGKGVPMPGAHVDIWHCDTQGVYSDEASGGIQQEDTKGQKWLRGYQVTDDRGAVTFDTIYPGWYMGRAVHIHFKVRSYSPTGQKTYEFTSQLFFEDTLSDVVFEEAVYKPRGNRPVRNTNDGIYQARSGDGTTAGAQMTLRPTKRTGSAGYAANFHIGIDLSRPQTGRFGDPGGGAPGGPGGGPGGPGGFGRRMPTVLTAPVDALTTGLSLTGEQTQKISRIQEKARGNRDAEQVASQQVDVVLTAKQKQGLPALLGDIQTVTRAGLPAALYAALALTGEQKAKIAALNQEAEKTIRAQFERSRQRSGPPDFEAMQEMRTKNTQKILAILNAKQKALVDNYRKEHPDAERGEFPGPPPGGGGPGGPPPGF